MSVNEDNKNAEEEMEDEPLKGGTKWKQAGKGPRLRPKNTSGNTKLYKTHLQRRN